MPDRRRAAAEDPSPRDAWLLEFRQAMHELRPHLGGKVLTAIAAMRWAQRGEMTPQASAKAYHDAQAGTPPAPPPPKARTRR